MKESDLGHTYLKRNSLKNLLPVCPKTAIERRKRKKNMAITKLFALHPNAITSQHDPPTHIFFSLDP